MTLNLDITAVVESFRGEASAGLNQVAQNGVDKVLADNSGTKKAALTPKISTKETLLVLLVEVTAKNN